MPTMRGRVERVEPPNQWGFVKIHVVPEGGEYPVKMDTSDEARIREALTLRDSQDLADVVYDENPVTKWNDKVKRDVTYPNRRWDRATVVPRMGANGQQGQGFDTQGFDAPPPARAEQEYGRKTNPSDAWRMALTSGSERAVQSLPYLPENQRDFGSQKAVALAWAKFIYYTDPPTANEIVREVERSLGGFPLEQPVPSGAATGQGYDQPPPHGDDDIPF